MILITRAATDMELVECGDSCEFAAIRDEAEALGWVWDENDDMWRCEQCQEAHCEYWGIRRPLVAA